VSAALDEFTWMDQTAPAPAPEGATSLAVGTPGVPPTAVRTIERRTDEPLIGTAADDAMAPTPATQAPVDAEMSG